MKDFYYKVYFWLFVGLLLTFASGFMIMLNTDLLISIANYYLIIFIVQIVLCVFLSVRIRKMDSNLCKVIYILYCLLTGCTLSLILVTVKVSSIIFIFLVTALLFGVFALFGKYTKIDLTKITTFLFIGLLGVVVLEIINLFLLNNTLDIVLCVISIFVFLGFIAWDMQKVRRMIESGMTDDNYAIIMAFQLYLDFINVFIDLIRLFGKRD